LYKFLKALRPPDYIGTMEDKEDWILKNKKRPSKKKHYLNITKEVAQRSTCLRTIFGAIIVKDDAIVSTGYVGAPRGAKDCFELGFCWREKKKIPHGQKYELCRSVHAEQNAIINAARTGANLFGGDMYIYGEDAETGKLIDTFPCFICKKMIINAGIARVICSTPEGIDTYPVEDWVLEAVTKDILETKGYSR